MAIHTGDGYIDLKVKTETVQFYTALYTMANATASGTSWLISTLQPQPYYWGQTGVRAMLLVLVLLLLHSMEPLTLQ